MKEKGAQRQVLDLKANQFQITQPGDLQSSQSTELLEANKNSVLLKNFAAGIKMPSQHQFQLDRGAYIDDSTFKRGASSSNKLQKAVNQNSNSGLLSNFVTHQQTAFTTSEDQSTQRENVTQRRRAQTRQGGFRKQINTRSGATIMMEQHATALGTVSSSEANQSYIAIQAQQPDLFQYSAPSRNHPQQTRQTEDMSQSAAFGLTTEGSYESHTKMMMGRRTAMHNRPQDVISNFSGAYTLEPPEVGSDEKKNMAARPSTQGRKPACGGKTRHGLGINRAQTAMQPVYPQPSSSSSQQLMRKQKNRVFQKPMDHSESFTSANLRIKQQCRELSSNNNRSIEPAAETQIQSYKLVLQKTDLALKKLRKNLDGRNSIKQRAGGTLNDLASMKPDQLAEVRDLHLLEASISSQPKQNKSGLFDTVARSSSPQLKSNKMSLGLSVNKKLNQDSEMIQICSQEQSLVANQNMKEIQHQPQQTIKQEVSGDKMPHSLLYARTKDQRKQNDRHVKVLQSELKELKSMEPYAHRMKKQFENQQQGKADEHVGNTYESKAESLLPTMSNKQIELWLNDTLEFQLQETHEEQMRYWKEITRGQLTDNLPIPMKPRIVKPLMSLEIDRIALDKVGMHQNSVDRLYRGLYAGSMGVFDTIRTSILTVPEKDRYVVMGRLWTSFQMLLQHCCPSNFKMIGRKLVEDQMAEINKVKQEFSSYKVNLENTAVKLESELNSMRRQNIAVQDERDVSVQQRQDAEKRLNSIQQKHEEEIRLRLDFELKINKLHNLTMALRNRETALNSKIEEQEHDNSQCRLRLKTQQEEIVKLRSQTLQQKLEKQLDDTKIVSVMANEKETKEKLLQVTENMQEKDLALSKKTNLTMKLQTAVDQRESKIRALQDMIEDHDRKDKQTDEQQEQYHKQIRLQERNIQEAMQGMSETDEQLASVRRNLEATSFNVFEFQMSLARTKDLEAQLDKLLESTTDQRKVIEDFKDEIAKKKSTIDVMIRKDNQNQNTIMLLQGTTAQLTRELKVMTEKHDDLTVQKSDLEQFNGRQRVRITELDKTVLRLRTQIEQLEKKISHTDNLLSTACHSLESFKLQAITWEEKFHKLAIDKDRLQKLATDYDVTIDDYKDKLIYAESAHQEIAGNLRTENAMTEGELVHMEGLKRDAELSLMQRSITINVLKRLLHGLIDQLQYVHQESKQTIVFMEVEHSNTIASHQIKIGVFVEKLRSAQYKVDSAAKEIDKLQGANTNQITKLSQAREENERLKHKINDLLKDAESISSSQHEVTELTVEIESEKGVEVMVQTEKPILTFTTIQAIQIIVEGVKRKDTVTHHSIQQQDEVFVESPLKTSIASRIASRNVSLEQASQHSFGMQPSIDDNKSASSNVSDQHITHITNQDLRTSNQSLVQNIDLLDVRKENSGQMYEQMLIPPSDEQLDDHPHITEPAPQNKMRGSQHSWQEGAEGNEQDGYNQLVSSPMYGSDSAVGSNNAGDKGETRENTEGKREDIIQDKTQAEIDTKPQLVSLNKPVKPRTLHVPEPEHTKLRNAQDSLGLLKIEESNLVQNEAIDKSQGSSVEPGSAQGYQLQLLTQKSSSKESIVNRKAVFQQLYSPQMSRSRGSQNTIIAEPAAQESSSEVQVTLIAQPPPGNVKVKQKQLAPSLAPAAQQPKKPKTKHSTNIKGLIRSTYHRP